MVGSMFMVMIFIVYVELPQPCRLNSLRVASMSLKNVSTTQNILSHNGSGRYLCVFTYRKFHAGIGNCLAKQFPIQREFSGKTVFGARGPQWLSRPPPRDRNSLNHFQWPSATRTGLKF